MNINRNKGKRVFSVPLENVVKEGVSFVEFDYSLGIVKDGQQDDFPQYIAKIVNESPIASACIQRLYQFISGRSLNSEVKDIEVNKNQTL